MAEKSVSVASLISLYESTPRMVLYDRDLEKGNPLFESIINKYGTHLNPLEVVLRSVINRFAESLSEESLAPSHRIALLNAHFMDIAIKEVTKKAETDRDFLVSIHDRWLSEFKNSLMGLVTKERVSTDELVYRLGTKFRISALSTTKAIQSLL